MNIRKIIPTVVLQTLKTLEENGFQAYIVGGCVRDMLIGREPKDWDVTTNAIPEQVMQLFDGSKYENEFGTVLIPTKYLRGLVAVSSNISLDSKQKEQMIDIAKQYMNQVDDITHQDDHSQRVAATARLIAEDVAGVNPDVLEVAAWFHDVGRIKSGTKDHIVESQLIWEEEAGKILDKNSVEQIKQVIFHQFEANPVSYEQAILREADIIDGVFPDRVAKAMKKRRTSHIDWLKKDFKQANIYRCFITNRGKEMMQKAIKEFNEANFGIKLPELTNEEKGIVEVTTYRVESKYSDKRHPDAVRFATTLQEDLSRRDFTINAIALRVKDVDKLLKTVDNYETMVNVSQKQLELIDLYGGETDLKAKKIRAVGHADERFNEDALRMMRAIRFAVQLGFAIEPKTLDAIRKNAANLNHVSKERVRDELIGIIQSPKPAKGMELLHETGLLGLIIPEIELGFSVTQSRHHYHGPYNTVFKHLLASLEHCPSEKLEVRLAAILHDVGKPETKHGEGELATFYNHEYVSARLARKILERLKFPKKVVEKVVLLVRNHMFYYNVDEVGESGVRRVVRKVGLENINDLIDVRIADRLGSGVAKAVPYKLRHFRFMVEKVSQDPISVKQLKVDGNGLMQELGLPPGPKIGAILDVLLGKVIEQPELNQQEALLNLSRELINHDLDQLREMAKEKIKKEQKKEEKEIKRKYRVG